MGNGMRTGLLALGIMVQLMATGCQGGGSGLSGLIDSLFGGGSSSTDVVEFASIGEFNFDDSGGGVSTGSPEPATIALFGGGLAGLAFLRRRQTRKQSRT